jgi:two-component system chemotaxis response regulator CheY
MKTCLVVDDSSVIRKVARRILEGLDFQIVEAEDGEKALEACKRIARCDPARLEHACHGRF